MVQMYFTKYWRRLKGSNATYIRQTIALLKALNKFMQSTTTDSNTWVVSVNEFLTLAHANHINVYKIDRYLRESKLGRGVVALFPSYALLDNMYRNWTAAAGIVDRIAKRKPVFVKSSTSSGDVLELYSARIKAAGSTGALLLSVVGGRLSEGINFSDKLGRAVVIVGVPFPSLASLELAE
ncbi:DEAD H (Asp-Glu-Ala-Asp His) box helicase 11 [Coemansia sp. S155-1]|nr:DEAD H (Asp-Glu-Ala-Asp His) box helicase 11 [Coemansia sp. S155-1]